MVNFLKDFSKNQIKYRFPCSDISLKLHKMKAIPELWLLPACNPIKNDLRKMFFLDFSISLFSTGASFSHYDFEILIVKRLLKRSWVSHFNAFDLGKLNYGKLCFRAFQKTNTIFALMKLWGQIPIFLKWETLLFLGSFSNSNSFVFDVFEYPIILQKWDEF
jgi:hypothetical protein